MDDLTTSCPATPRSGVEVIAVVLPNRRASGCLSAWLSSLLRRPALGQSCRLGHDQSVCYAPGYATGRTRRIAKLLASGKPPLSTTHVAQSIGLGGSRSGAREGSPNASRHCTCPQ